jgi:sulfate permease, SulP family
VLEEAIVELHKRGVRVMLTGANARVEGKLQKAGIIDLIGRENFFKTFADAMQACRVA